MPNFTAGTSFTDGVTNDVTALKLNALVADAVPTSSLALTSTNGTIANFTSSTANITLGTIPTLTAGTTTGTAGVFTSGTITTALIPTGTFGTTTSTAATITTGTIPTLVATTLITTGTGTAAAPAIVPTGDTNTGIFFPAADTIAFSEGGAEAMRIDSSGNVGIGTTSPSQLLTVGSPETPVISIAKVGVYSSGASLIITRDTTNDIETLIGTVTGTLNSVVGSATNHDLEFRTNNTERLRITSSGVVRIGTATELLTSANILEVSGTNGIGIKATGGAGNPCMLAWNSAASGNNTFAIFYTEASPSSVGSIDFNRASTLTRYNTTSDATLKNIIGDSSGEESVSILKNTKIRDYTWKKDITNKVNVGVVAQELYEVFKGAVSVGGDIVSKDSEGNDITTYRPWGVDKTAFTFHLVAGWKAHEKLIQDLKTENDSLRSRIEALEAA